MEKELFDLLKSGLSQIDTSLCKESCLSVLKTLFDQISLYNPSLKLVGADGKDLIIKHILDSMAPYNIVKKEVREGFSFADLGSGSGLPGIVLAAAFEKYDFTLVERMGRRAGFLRNVTAISALNDRVEVAEKNLHELNRTFDIITFRAFRHMKDIASDLVKITKPGSVIFAYKSSNDDIKQETYDLENIAPDVFEWQTVSYSVPFLDAERKLLIITRV